PPLARLRTYTLQEPIKIIPTNHKATVIFSGIVQTIILDHQVSTKIKTETIRTRTSITKTGIKETIILRGTTREGTNSSREITKFMKMNTTSSSGSGTLSGNTITNPKEDLKVVERETEATKDKVHPTNNESTKDIQPLVVPTESPTLNSEPVISPIIEPVASPVVPRGLTKNLQFLIHPDCKIISSVTKLMTNERNFFKSSRI
nr:hypothetical protein [Tanacetum cinerariifolium]